MRAAALTTACVLLLSWSCGERPPDSGGGGEGPDVLVSILPQVRFLERIGGDRPSSVTALVSPGHSPATYELDASDMRRIERAEVWFRIGVPFEDAWVDRITGTNPGMLVVDTHASIDRRPIDRRATPSHNSEDDDAGTGGGVSPHDHGHGTPDPHFWLSPRMVGSHIPSIVDGLIAVDPGGEELYRRNAERFAASIDSLSSEIARILAPVEGRAFVVFHPSWGYFADEFGLIQLSIETGGREPSPSELAVLLDLAAERGVTAVFGQPQFSDRTASIVASELGVDLLMIDPLSEDWRDNLLETAENLRSSLDE